MPALRQHLVTGKEDNPPSTDLPTYSGEQSPTPQPWTDCLRRLSQNWSKRRSLVACPDDDASKLTQMTVEVTVKQH